jgi:predicted dehydrogenase
MGSRHANSNLESLAYLHMQYPSGMVAHIHVNWMAPVKIRRTLIGGTAKMIVYDDLESSEKVKLYDKGVIVTKLDRDSAMAVQWDYRTGDMVAPKLAHREALRAEAEHFVQCVSQRSQPLVPGEMGLRVLRVLQAANLSLARQGGRVSMEEVA